VTTSWSADPPDARTAPVTCRGCARALWPVGAEGQWGDADGRVVCFVGGRTGHAIGSSPHQVLHQPMPVGLRGAPESQG
jgi:hypothetical protein